jgi:hypothetical protein
MSLLEEDKQIEIIFSFYSELVYLVSNTIDIIEKDISRDNDIKTDKAKAKAILTNILKLRYASEYRDISDRFYASTRYFAELEKLV